MVLTESQKEIQRKRKISEAVSEKQEEKGQSKRRLIDELDQEQIIAKKTGAEIPQLVGDRILTKTQIAEEKLMKEQEAQKLAGQGIAKDIGQFEDVQNIPTELDREQALIAGAKGVVPSALEFGGYGLAAGLAATAATGGVAAPTVPILAGIGLGVGTVKGFYNDYTSNLKSQASGIIKGRTYSLTDAEKALRDTINMQNSRIGDPGKNVELFNEQLSLVTEAYQQLKLDTDENLNRWLDDVDGTKQLMKFEVFFNTGRDKQFNELMNEATLYPDANRVLVYQSQNE